MGHPQHTPDLSELASDVTIAEVLERWPRAMPVLFRYRMACPGCAMSRFETLAEAADVYGLSLERLVRELEEAIAAEAGGGSHGDVSPT